MMVEEWWLAGLEAGRRRGTMGRKLAVVMLGLWRAIGGGEVPRDGGRGKGRGFAGEKRRNEMRQEE